jgi:hypothetical protein
MLKNLVYKQWICCVLGMNNLLHFYTLSTKQTINGFEDLFLYKFNTQTINKLSPYIHRFGCHLLDSGDFINLSTQSTGPIETNFNNLIKGLIV